MGFDRTLLGEFTMERGIKYELIHLFIIRIHYVYDFFHLISAELILIDEI